MPVSLKTQAERTAKTPIPACRARVGGLCGFRGTAERVPTGNPKPDVAPPCGSVAETASAEEDRLRAVFGGGMSRKRRGSRRKPRGRARPLAVTSAHSAGSLGLSGRGC